MPEDGRTFHDLIAANKRNSVLLCLAMFAILTALGGVIGAAYGAPEAGLAAAAILSLVLLLYAWTGGSHALMSSCGAREIEKEEAPQLFNVVEEMSIAADVPMPRVCLIESAAPNAFAAGSDPEHAAVAITTGLLRKLNREELQGVMAHEIAHIRNYDIRFAMLMAVLAGGISIVSETFLRTADIAAGASRRRSSRGNQIQALFFVLGIVFAIFAPLFATIVRLALSRQREYLADASAVEFTRNPAGFAGALSKLSLDETPLEMNAAVAPLFIVNPKLGCRGGADSLFSTHPPLESRIRRLLALQS